MFAAVMLYQNLFYPDGGRGTFTMLSCCLFLSACCASLMCVWCIFNDAPREAAFFLLVTAPKRTMTFLIWKIDWQGEKRAPKERPKAPDSHLNFFPVSTQIFNFTCFICASEKKSQCENFSRLSIFYIYPKNAFFNKIVVFESPGVSLCSSAWFGGVKSE